MTEASYLFWIVLVSVIAILALAPIWRIGHMQTSFLHIK